MRFFLFGSFSILVLTPLLAFAQGLVPCSGGECQFCHIAILADTIIEFLITITGIVAAILFVYAGFLMVTARGNVSQVSKGKGIFTNVVIGLIILLASWLIVDTVMKMLAGSQAYGMWRDVQCAVLPTYGTGATLVEPITFVNASGQTETAQVVQGPTSNSSGTGCADCVEVSSGIAACKSGANCQVSAAYYEKFKNLSGGLEITEGYPPTRTHQAKCHTTGYCTDVVFADRTWNTQRINAFIAEADRAGMRAVYEPSSSGSCSGISQCLPYSTTRATGNHFSLYLKE